jgi:hypothetical protein
MNRLNNCGFKDSARSRNEAASAMGQKIVISLGVGLMGLVAWTALGTGPSTQPFDPDDIAVPAADLQFTADSGPSSAASVDVRPVADTDTDAPSDSPAPSSSDRSRRSNDDGSFPPRGHRGTFSSMKPNAGFMGAGKGQFSEEEVERAKPEAEEFWQRNSPERFRLMQSLSAGRQKNTLESATTRLFLNYKQIHETDPELYAVIVSRVQAEDLVFGMVNDLKSSGGDAKSSKPLRAAVESLVKLNLKERHLRLDRLATTLKEQQDKLAVDENPSHFDSLVDRQLDTEINQRPHARPGGAFGHSAKP